MLLLICLHHLDFSRPGARRGAPRGMIKIMATKNWLYLPYRVSEQLRIFSATGPNTVFLCCPAPKLNGRAEKISALGLWGWSVWTQADICYSEASPR